MQRLRQSLIGLLAAVFLAANAAATWSICIIDTRTGEMCVASATCVPGSDLMLWTPMMLPDVGIAVCQAASPQEMKVTMHEYMLLGHSPARLKKRVDNKFGNVGARQYAIIDMEGRYLVHTGDTNGAWAGHLTGQIGDMIYTVQGNVLAGEAVITAAEDAILNTPGDMSQKVMAAMEAAMNMGGDGRCSCDVRFPDSCGTPPPNFSQTATIGYILIARAGDSTGACSGSGGCANGNFYLRLNEPNHMQPGTDPVILLRAQYDNWRIAQQGLPDALNSVVVADTQMVQAGDGAVNYWLDLYDIDGAGITHGGATITLEHRRGSAGLAALQSVTDHGDGTYTVEVLPGTQAGLDDFAFRVDSGSGYSALLMPSQKLMHEGPTTAPIGSSMAVSGLAAVEEIRAAHVSDDGLRVWMIAKDGPSSGGSGSGEFQLMRADRASLTEAFSAGTIEVIENSDASRIESLFVSDDELEMTLSARNEMGVEAMYTSRREAVTDPWAAPKPETEINSDLGDGNPWISQDGLQMLFTSGRDGQKRLYRAKRLNTDSIWYPPFEMTSLTSSVNSGSGQAMLTAFDTRAIFATKYTNRTGLRHGDLKADGKFEARGLMPGEAVKNVDLCGALVDGSVMWQLHPAAAYGAGVAQLRVSHTAINSFTVAPTTISASAGGTLSFELMAGSNHANANFEILVGNPGAGLKWNGHILPIRPNWDATGLMHNLIASGDPNWQQLRGALDASGNASVTLNLAAGAISNPNLIGTTLAFCFAADPNGSGFVSQAGWVEIQP